MKLKTLQLVILVVLLAPHQRYSVHGAPITNLYPESVRREVDLIQSLFVLTNSSFDKKVCASLGLQDKHEVTFHQVSFIFSYPRTNDMAPSACELGSPDALRFMDGKVVRVASQPEGTPLTYVRVVDSGKTNITAEVDALVAVSSMASPRVVRYHRRSFHFVYADGWKDR
jgi:hypothetical protein